MAQTSKNKLHGYLFDVQLLLMEANIDQNLLTCIRKFARMLYHAPRGNPHVNSFQNGVHPSPLLEWQTHPSQDRDF